MFCVAVTALFVVTVTPVRASTSTTTGLAPTDREYTRLVVGDGHTCVLLNNGSVSCWGDNTYGQLGVPTITSSKTPVTVGSFGDNRFAVELAAGKNHTCALLNDSSISCWGHNGFGSLGVSGPGGHTPKNSTGITFRGVAAGGFNTCATLESGDVACWGRNSLMQLGKQTSSTAVTAPELLDRPEGVESFVAVETGDNHSCALSSVGEGWCWGVNSEGELGVGYSSEPSSPMRSYLLSSSQKPSEIVVGGSHSCVLTDRGNLVCWGLNDYGQVGEATTDSGTTPHYFSAETAPLVSISTGVTHSCGIDESRNPICWGNNEDGQLGDDSMESSSVPVHVQLPAGVTVREVAAGDSHTCALLDGDDVMCWGNNTKGKLGDGTTTQRLVPTKVVQLHTAPGNSVNSTSLITHNEATIHTEFSTTDVASHRVLEYGTDEFLTGDTNSVDLGHFGTVKYIASGAHHSCMVIAGGYVKCWGDNSDGALGTGDVTSHTNPVDVKELGGQARVVAVGKSHSCAVMSTGGLKCWGDNSSGQLGDGTVLSKKTPVTADLTGVIDVVLGDAFSCALTVDGLVKCWGTNSFGQLGTVGQSTSMPVTVAVDSNHTVTSLSSSSTRVCAVLSNATVKCWGENISGVASPGVFTSTVANVDVGESHACATLHNGSVQCWGDDSQGQLGNGDTDSSGLLVTATLGASDRAVAVSTATNSSCAVLSNGTVKCWGDGATGTTGFGTATDVHTPTSVSELESVVQLSLAELHGCALTKLGEVSCWGSNTRQQRGTGGNSITAPETISSQIHATVVTEINGLTDDQAYFYRVNTTSTNGVSLGDISTFNTTELPTLPPNDDPPLDTPVDIPPSLNETPLTQIAPGAPTTPVSAESPVLTESLRRRPSVKVGSLTSVRSLLRRLDFTVPKTTSSTKMWMTVLNKRVCRVYGARLWAIRKGTCQIMVLKMGPSRRLTMSRTQIKIVRSAR